MRRSARRGGTGRPAALTALLALGASGCGGTLTTTAGSRFEGRVLGEGSGPTAVQVTPAARWRAGPGLWAGGVGYTPTLVVEPGAAPLVRHRAEADLGSARPEGLRPYGSLALDYGAVRPGDLSPEEALEPRPGAGTLESYAARLEGGWRGQLTRRTRLDLGAALDRSAGLGSAALTLPELSRTALALRGQHQRSRTLALDGGVKVSRFVLEEGALLVVADAGATLRLSRGVSLTATAGGAGAQGSAQTPGSVEVAGASFEARPVAGLGAAWETPGGRGPGARFSLATRPDFDRLDGGLRQRLHVQGSLGVEPWREARLGAAVQWASDIGGEGERRRLLSADANLSLKLAEDWGAEVGVRAFVQGRSTTPGAQDPSEVRVRLGLSRRLGVR